MSEPSGTHEGALPPRGSSGILGIFVGGGSRRMGGKPKGLLTAPCSTETLVERLIRIGHEAGLEVVLVGAAAPYAEIAPELPRLRDDPTGIGPLGGLRAFLAHAGAQTAIAVACDMPFVDVRFLHALLAEPAGPAVIAPRHGEDGRWEPLCARYDPPRVLTALDLALERDVRSFQWLFRELDVGRLSASDRFARELTDWDTPDDVESSR